MNGNIEKLAQAAGIIIDTDAAGNYAHLATYSNQTYKILNDFAELIILECANLNIDPESSSKILKHFNLK